MDNIKQEYTKAKRALFDKVYGQRLNPEQCRAVFTVKGPLLVLAGAGSGKTTVLVNRIAYLIRYGNAYYSDYMPEGVTEETVAALIEAVKYPTEQIKEILPEFITEPCSPWSVLAITFTNKAAKEIKERLDRTFADSDVTNSIWAGTFHSVCVRILRKYGERLGYGSGFSIYDTDDKKRLLTACMKELRIDDKRLSLKTVANEISRAKDSLIFPEDFEITHDPRSSDIKRIYELYQKRLMEYNALDFDDIIMKTVELLLEDEEVRGYYQRKFRYILVDEYQDTNHAQFRLTEILAGGSRNIMVVGDDDQSIYRFRGATVENILNFDKTYPEATVVKLEQNYRSTENILNAANAVISHNDKRHSKSLWCDKGEGEKITVRETADGIEEGRYIINKIHTAVREGRRKYSDFAILYRVNELARSLETSFVKSGVPYKILGGMRFYERKEIKDMIAYLSVCSSESDNLRLKRIINEPKRKIGAATVEAVEEIANTEGVSMFDVMRRAKEYTALGKSADKLFAFCQMINECRGRSHLPSELIVTLFDKSGYRNMLVEEGFEGEGKIDNVNELVAGAIEYEKRCGENGDEPTLHGFLEEISLVSDIDKYDESSDSVVLMTIHSAKGLEFPVVFLAGMEDGIFPSEQNRISEEEMSEERRLAYVAITRAKEKLFVTYAKSRTMYGKTAFGTLSSFIRVEVPASLREMETLRLEPPRSNGFGDRYKEERRENRELNRTPDMFGGFKTQNTRGAAKFGVRRFAPGTRVSHMIFGAGTIIGAKDMGGDVLYEVKFDTVGTKKLMATFAKLTEI